MRLVLILIFLTFVSSCSTVPKSFNEKKFEPLIGQRVTLQGQAANAKMGALLIGDNWSIWVDDIHSWPDGYYLGDNDCKTLKVSGTVIERYDLPVFIHKKGEVEMSGIPMPEGTDLRKASRRFLLRDAKWVVINGNL